MRHVYNSNLHNLNETARALASASVTVVATANAGDLSAARLAVSNAIALANNLSAALGAIE